MQPGALPNLVLTGFMATGKTRIGQEVAQRLNRPFVDMDAEIERRAGKSILRIFAEEGEAAFRRMEADLCRELSVRSGLVIATGGGALVEPTNRAAMKRTGTVVCLTCETGEILRRAQLTGTGDRPLLQVADPRTEIEQLMAVRQQAYAALPWQIDTTSLSVDQVAQKVTALAEVVTLPVRHTMGGQAAPTEVGYSVHIGPGLLSYLGGALRAAGIPEGSRAAVVSNPVVAPLYGGRVESSLRESGFRPVTCSVTDGERDKTLVTVAALYDQFLASELDRGSTVLSLGGGVTGDIAGFAAATFLRGVRFVQVPTTILAMADASVGGKTGVDLAQGKNLVGAFKQPTAVIIDPAVLTTLPEAEIRSGMAEVIKHGIIDAPDLFAELESHQPGAAVPLSTPQLARTVQVKIDVVELDPFEEGRRAVLNLGHTVGHGLEKLSDFTLRHGEAVAIGMVAAARISAELGRAAPGLSERIEAALRAWGLPIRCPGYSVEAIWGAMVHDKKRRGGSLRWVLPHEIGHVELVDDVPKDVVASVLRELSGEP
jgi:shikimate kinase/3-dehydroquinate synthase